MGLVYLPPTPLSRKAYRLRCSMVLHPFPSVSDLEAARNVTAERFIRDLEKQGWHWCGERFTISGPVPYIGPITPSRKDQTGAPGEYVQNRPTLDESEGWMYFIAGVFWRDLPPTQILVANPSGTDLDDRIPIQYPKGVLS